MRLRGQIIGALNLFGSGQTRIDEADGRVVQALADTRRSSFCETERGRTRGAWWTSHRQCSTNAKRRR
jgi:hypothetical protein